MPMPGQYLRASRRSDSDGSPNQRQTVRRWRRSPGLQICVNSFAVGPPYDVGAPPNPFSSDARLDNRPTRDYGARDAPSIDLWTQSDLLRSLCAVLKATL